MSLVKSHTAENNVTYYRPVTLIRRLDKNCSSWADGGKLNRLVLSSALCRRMKWYTPPMSPS